MGTSHSHPAPFGWIGLVLILVTLVSGAPGAAGAAQQSQSSATWRNLYDWPNGDGYVGWHSSTTAPDDYGLQSAVGDRPGLWLWTLGGKKTYDTADYAE